MQLLLEEEPWDVLLSCDLGLFPPWDPEHLSPPLHLHMSLTFQGHLCLDHASNQPCHVRNVILSCESFAHPTMCSLWTWEPPCLSLEWRFLCVEGVRPVCCLLGADRWTEPWGTLSSSRWKSNGPVGFYVSAVDTQWLIHLLAPEKEWRNSSPHFWECLSGLLLSISLFSPTLAFQVQFQTCPFIDGVVYRYELILLILRVRSAHY